MGQRDRQVFDLSNQEGERNYRYSSMSNTLQLPPLHSIGSSGLPFFRPIKETNTFYNFPPIFSPHGHRNSFTTTPHPVHYEETNASYFSLQSIPQQPTIAPFYPHTYSPTPILRQPITNTIHINDEDQNNLERPIQTSKVSGKIIAQPAPFQIANYNVHPICALMFDAPLVENESIHATLIQDSTKMTVAGGFQTGDVRIVRAGTKVVYFNGLKFNKKGPIKADLQSKQVNRFDCLFRIRLTIGDNHWYTDTFKMVSSYSQLPTDIRHTVRPTRKPSKARNQKSLEQNEHHTASNTTHLNDEEDNQIQRTKIKYEDDECITSYPNSKRARLETSEEEEEEQVQENERFEKNLQGYTQT